MKVGLFGLLIIIWAVMLYFFLPEITVLTFGFLCVMAGFGLGLLVNAIGRWINHCLAGEPKIEPTPDQPRTPEMNPYNPNNGPYQASTPTFVPVLPQFGSMSAIPHGSPTGLQEQEPGLKLTPPSPPEGKVYYDPTISKSPNVMQKTT